MYIFVYNRMISCKYKKDMPSNLVGKLSPRVWYLRFFFFSFNPQYKMYQTHLKHTNSHSPKNRKEGKITLL